MIAVVEGPSAAGKTSWIRRYQEVSAVWEYQAAGAEPSYSDGSQEAAEFWVDANARRWREAVELEARAGLAVCGTDPLKLHYVWMLWRIGVVDHELWSAEAHQVRLRFEEGAAGAGGPVPGGASGRDRAARP